CRGTLQELFIDILDDPHILINQVTLAHIYNCDHITFHLYQLLLHKSGPVSRLQNHYGVKRIKKLARHCIEETLRGRMFLDELIRRFPPERLAELLNTNRRYHRYVEPAYRHRNIIRMLSAEFMNSIPDNYASLYPEARAMKRHFVIHAGPTNSGKTHDAIVRLAKARSGVYLAPLRLLAYEQYERLTGMGVKCSMITGEERILVKDATHRSSTIEMLALEDRVEVAVIDEAQMAADPERGGAWTTAILGVRAESVHVCCAPNMTDCLIRMIENCEDTYEVHWHRRKTPLELEHAYLKYPDGIMDGDALIVFSRRDVQECAADLASRGIKCSVVYGNLPYDVRHAEAAKFISGETKVVVATDAIGMGMNLPIRRVVFLRTDKFDGKESRILYPNEIKQIAGRAGRYGIYNKGFVNSLSRKSTISQGLKTPDETIEKAVISIPPIFFEKDGKVSEILAAWDSLPATRDYDKSDIDEKIELAKELEKISDNKPLVLDFISIPIDAKVETVHTLWADLFTCRAEGRPADLDYLFEIYDPALCGTSPRSAERLEILYKVYDLLYAYSSRYGDDEDVEKIYRIKRTIADKLNDILKKQVFQGRVCKYCGRRIPWLTPYPMCDGCFRTHRR
ncbi:MAG: helicase, partial [Lachnospiraceae bacterium]|nr:helicase [Lachnospiraceae bacterium]